MAIEDEVRAASQAFYAALNKMLNGDASALAEIWSHGDAVTTMHPVGGREVGWQQVRQTWEEVAKVSTGGQVTLDDQIIHAAGDMAYEVGFEKGQFTLAGKEVAIDHRVTNVYQRDGGSWKIVHHHTDVAPDMAQALNE